MIEGRTNTDKFHPNPRGRCETREAASSLSNVAAVFDPDKIHDLELLKLIEEPMDGTKDNKKPIRFGSFISVDKLR